MADRFHNSEENKQRLREILPWWRGNTISDQALRIFPEQARGLKDKGRQEELLAIAGSARIGNGPGYVDKRGLKGA